MAKLRDVTSIDNGAGFLDADLHIHSFGASADVKDPTLTPAAIVDSAIRQGLSVIAITDHNSDANIVAVLEYANQFADHLLVVPGVEVTTAHGHLLVYFAPERVEHLAKFMLRLELVGERGKENTHTAKSMADAISEAYKLGGIAVAAHIDRDRTGFEMFASGHQNWKRDILTNPGLYGLECDESENLRWYSEVDDTTGAGGERRKIFEARKLVDALRPRIHLAHLQGSDAHSLAEFETNDPTKPWTRFKLNELSFEALRVALVDPTARVRAWGAVPRSFPRVRGMVFTGGFLHGEVIHFNNNMNCFIGGRGTGKSTAIRALAFALGQFQDFRDYDNCPDSVSVFCEDENGVLYRYLRTRTGHVDVKAKEDDGPGITDVPEDSFRIEYFGQGELAEVARDPLNTPERFQEFLDRHIRLRDLADAEAGLVHRLRENAARLAPLEAQFASLPTKRKALLEVRQKLKLAEEGNLRGIVTFQTKLTAEKSLRETILQLAERYKRGVTLASFESDYDQLATNVGECTDDVDSLAMLDKARNTIEETNKHLRRGQAEINQELTRSAQGLSKLAASLKQVHARLDADVAEQIADLKARGLAAGNLAELNELLKQQSQLTSSINTIEQRKKNLSEARKEREDFLRQLEALRAQRTGRRKEQLREINRHLGATIRDYRIIVKYDDAGIIEEFAELLKVRMHGTYLADAAIEEVCRATTPSRLAQLVYERKYDNLSDELGVSEEWARRIVDRLSPWEALFELQAIDKPPKPIIVVKTKAVPARDIPVFNLSDGQRHTILLTIAMLAESNVPLVIDQPEDDLDNAFIFSSVVSTLRRVKERRQIILVTHNANIAVLGDSELLLPMNRESDCGRVEERGSIDRVATKGRVQEILEGGPAAFLRRKEIYGH